MRTQSDLSRIEALIVSEQSQSSKQAFQNDLQQTHASRELFQIHFDAIASAMRKLKYQVAGLSLIQDDIDPDPICDEAVEMLAEYSAEEHFSTNSEGTDSQDEIRHVFQKLTADEDAVNAWWHLAWMGRPAKGVSIVPSARQSELFHDNNCSHFDVSSPFAPELAELAKMVADANEDSDCSDEI